MIFFFDTETTGLPPRSVAPTESTQWEGCRIVQIAWELYDADTGEFVKKEQFIIRPDNFEIPDSAARIHGINTVIANEQGSDIHDVMNALATDLAEAKIAVAHNMAFDDRVLLSELYRYNLGDIAATWSSIEKKCTMLMGTLPRQKWPKLSELYTRLFGTAPDANITLHRADADVSLCSQCYFKLIAQNL